MKITFIGWKLKSNGVVMREFGNRTYKPHEGKEFKKATGELKITPQYNRG